MGFALRNCLLILALAGPVAAWSAEFRSIGEPAAILYDAPSIKAKKLYIVNRGYPVEIIVLVEGWAKVRDASGDLSWVELRNLSDKRMVMVSAPVVQVRQGAADNAPVVFEAQQRVLLEVLEPASAGWVRVQHSDGQNGYVRVAQVWGG